MCSTQNGLVCISEHWNYSSGIFYLATSVNLELTCFCLRSHEKFSFTLGLVEKLSFNLLNSFSLLNEFWGSRGCSQMVVFIGASSLSHSIDRYPNIKRRLGRWIKATPGLSFNPQADREKQVRHILRSVPRGEGIILWHDVLNNSITSHPQIKRTPLTPEQLVEKVSSVPSTVSFISNPS